MCNTISETVTVVSAALINLLKVSSFVGIVTWALAQQGKVVVVLLII